MDNPEPSQADNQDPAPESTPEPTSWKDGLGEGVKDHAALTNINDVPSLAKSYVNAQELIGKKGVILPKDGDADDLGRFYGELGRPDEATAYKPGEFEADDSIKEYFQPEKMEAFKSIAHEAGLSQQQFEVVTAKYQAAEAQAIQNQLQANTEATQQMETELRSEWGAKYDENVSNAKKAYLHFGGDESVNLSADAIKIFNEVGKQISDDVIGTVSSGKRTPADAASEIKAIFADKSGPMYNANHPEHDAVNKKLDMLYEQAGGRVF